MSTDKAPGVLQNTPPDVKNIKWDFSGQVVLVTGAALGQGRSHAISFAKAGADLVICDIGHNVETVPYDLATKEELESVAKECEAFDVRVLPVVCDARDPAQVAAMVEAAIEQFGKIDVLVCNHGIHSIAKVAEMDEAMWDVMLDTNLKALFLCARAVAPHMIAAGRGKIVNTGSSLSLSGLPYSAHYTAAKHGVAGLSKALAIELAPHGINVNVVCPGGVADTRLSDNITAGQPEFIAELVKYGPWSLFEDEQSLNVGDISNAIMFLASDAARYITGQTLLVDQGASVT
jgi:NAD(P)-dependent dehydrogenase (short-subunit alcohol dehydrogenase family)